MAETHGRGRGRAALFKFAVTEKTVCDMFCSLHLNFNVLVLFL